MTESLYVLETGSYLRREGSALKVVKNRQVIDHIPAEGLKRLMLVGYVSLSGSVLDFLIQNRVETVFITPTGRFRARLSLDEHKHVELRRAQYLRLSDVGFTPEAAGIIVRGKINNMARLLLLRARQYKEESLNLAAVKIKSLAFGIRRIKDLDQLRGMEGAATRAYFASFPLLIRNQMFQFKGRNRRPPLDPVNALLSFVYTLLTNEVLSAIKACGLDPYLGALHEVSYGRPSLACDLVEEYRAFLGDRMVLGLINKKVIKSDDFIYRKKPPAEFVDEKEMQARRPVEMKPAISRTFVAAYEEMMKRRISYPDLNKKISYRWLILNQVRSFGAYLENPERVYRPFVWEN
jgi:CRISPR-associated protein Cas1